MKVDFLFRPNCIVRTINDKNIERDKEIKIITDSRLELSGSAFLALNGEKFKAGKFASQALKKKASVVIIDTSEEYLSESDLSQAPNDTCIIFVKDTLVYFQELAKIYSSAWKQMRTENFLIGLTGSNGKTSTKEILNFLMNSLHPGKVHCTKGNLNNHIGVPITLCELSDEHRVGIIEMGTNSPGEIDLLSDIVSPEAGLITNIGPAHLEKLVDLEGVYDEKSGLYRHYSQNSHKLVFVCDMNDEFLRRLGSMSDTYPYREGKDTSLEEGEYFIDQDDIHFRFNGKLYHFKNNYISSYHNKKNLMASLYLVLNLYPDRAEEIIKIAQEAKLPEMNRGSYIQKNGIQIFADAYNANPASMMASLESFVVEFKKNISKESEEHVAFVIGDMNELGEREKYYHTLIAGKLKQNVENLIKYSPKLKISIYFVGRMATVYGEGFKLKSVEAKKYNSTDELIKTEMSSSNIKDWNWVFLKASRSLQLERLLDIFDALER